MCSFIVLGMFWAATLYFALIYESSAVMLVFYMEAVYFVFSLVWLLFRRVTVSGRIEVPVGISESGKENFVKLVIRNKSGVPVQRVRALVQVEDGIGGRRERAWHKLATVPGGETGFMRNIVFDGTGTYTLTLKKLRIYEGTGLLYTTVSCKKSDAAQVQVIPTLREVSVRLTEATRNFYGEADVYDEHMPGHDNSEIFQIREYRRGDRLQNVHWKLTAKQEELMVKELSLPKSCPVVLFLAYHPGRKGKKQRTLASFLEVAVSLSFSVMEAGCPHYVAWYDGAEQDVKRLRVDDEESLFYFMGVLMRQSWEEPKEDIVRRYQEKYRQEPYVCGVSLDEKLVVKKEDEVLVQLPAEHPEERLDEMELVL